MRVPNHYHFVFGLRPQTEPFHLAYYLCLASCLAVNRPDRVTLYYHHEPWGPWWDWIRDRLELEQVELVESVSGFDYESARIGRLRYAHHADFVRVEKLIEHGGVYADMDSLFVNALPERLREKPFVIGREDPVMDARGELHSSLCNAVLIAEPGSEFAKNWLSRMGGAFDGDWSTHSCILPARIAEEDPALVHIEPSRSFFKHMYTRAGLRTLFTGCDRDNAGVYSFHLWNHLWWDPSRVRGTIFNHHMLTEDYVRFADTTYAAVARQFLPRKSRIRPTARFVARGTMGLVRVADRVVGAADPLFEALEGVRA